MSRVSSRDASVKPSGRKATARGQLTRLGLKISDGHDYRLEDALVPAITQAQAREVLKSVSGSLAQTIVDERRHA